MTRVVNVFRTEMYHTSEKTRSFNWVDIIITNSLPFYAYNGNFLYGGYELNYHDFIKEIFNQSKSTQYFPKR